MRKQITVTDEERDVIQEIARQLFEASAEDKRCFNISRVLFKLVHRWDKAKEQTKFKKGL